MKKVLEKINEVRTEIEVPKNRYNSHSGFYFRNLGDIFTAINPVFLKKKLGLHFLEDIVTINNQNYVKVTAVVYDLESEEKMETVAYAKEPVQKSNFDSAQITTSSSSVAKKSALSTLLCLDDTSEKNDTKNPPNNNQNDKPKFDKNTSLASEKQVKLIHMLIKQTNSDAKKLMEKYEIDRIESATFAVASDIINILNDKKERMNKDA